MKHKRDPQATMRPVVVSLVLAALLVLAFLITDHGYQLRFKNGEAELDLRPAEPPKATQPQPQATPELPLQSLPP